MYVPGYLLHQLFLRDWFTSVYSKIVTLLEFKASKNLNSNSQNNFDLQVSICKDESEYVLRFFRKSIVNNQKRDQRGQKTRIRGKVFHGWMFTHGVFRGVPDRQFLDVGRLKTKYGSFSICYYYQLIWFIPKSSGQNVCSLKVSYFRRQLMVC